VYKNRKLAWLVVLAMVFSIVAPLGVGTAAAQTQTPMDKLVAELQKVYPYVDEGEKVTIHTVRSNLDNLEDTDWNTVLGPLVTGQVKAEERLGANAQETLKQVALDAANIYYNTDSTVLKNNLTAFKNKNSSTFKALFGNEFTMDDLADFLLAARSELRSAAISKSDTILYGTNAKLVEAMPEIVKEAALEAIAQPKFNKFKGKLSAIGWSTDLLVEQHNVLVKAIGAPESEDELSLGQKAELALAKAWVRSEAVVEGGKKLTRAATNTLYEDTINVGDEVTYTLSIIGRKATGLVGFQPNPDSPIIRAESDKGTLKVTGLKEGTEQLIFYRDGEDCNAENDWIAKVNITVQKKTSSGGGGGSAAPDGTEIKIDKGGEVSEYGTTVEIPANAFAENFIVKVAKVSDVSGLTLPEGGQLVSEVLEITKDVKGDFTKPVTITMKFDKSKVDSEAEVALYYYDTATKTWIKLDNIKVDWEKGTVSGEINHFTKFAVIAVTPEKAPPVLTDIAGHWAEADIKTLVEKGAIAGYPDKTFRPNNNITRAEFATVLVKAFELEAKEGKVFTDTATHWAKEDIATANAYDIIKGYSDEKFGPNDQITREQAAVMIAKAADLTASEQAPVFSDSAKISDWARAAVAAAAEAEIIKGYPDGSFRPQGQATRAEAVTIIVRAMK
jgi:hypothetical protein